MKKYVELETTPYWHAAAEKEVKFLRRERGQQAAASMTNFAVFLILSFVAYYAYSRGVFDNWDVLGSLAYVRDGFVLFATNAANFLKEAWS